MINEPELVLDTQALLGEGPCWDQNKQLLYWVNILDKQLHVYSPHDKEDRIIQLEEYVSCVVPRSSGGVVLGLQSGFAALDLDTERVNFLAKPNNYPSSNRFNEGMIWVALWAGAKVMRWNPKTGELLQSIPIPARNVTSCTFGGEKMNELYITTARRDMSGDDFEKYPKTGSIFKLKTDVVGMKNFEFMG